MLPSDLGDTVGALAIGFVALGAIAALVYIFGGALRDRLSVLHVLGDLISHSPRWARKLFRTNGTLLFAVAVVFCLAFGSAVEDITDKMLDNEQETLVHHWDPRYYQVRILGSKRDHRFGTLFNDELKLNGLGHEIFGPDTVQVYNQALTSRLGSDDREFLDDPEKFLQEHVSAKRSCAANLDSLQRPAAAAAARERADRELNNARGFVNALYYLSKNWAYSQDRYYAELTGVQQRIDFSRSCFLIASWSAIIIAVGTLARLLRWGAGWAWHRFVRREPGGGQERERGIEALRLLRVSVVLIICAAICIVSALGYANAQRNFNERAFGYFASWVQLNHKTDRRMLSAIRWMETAAEYTALCHQVYKQAQQVVDAETQKPWASKRKPPAVVLDLDETVLDNSRFQAFLSRLAQPFSEDQWRHFLTHHENDVGLVPGAAEFLSFCSGRVFVAFISNRPDTARKETIDTLRRLNIDTEGLDAHETLRLQLRSAIGNKSKQARLEKVKAKYSVLALIGDSLSDLSDEFLVIEPDTTVDSRRAKVTDHREEFGTTWFILPNPVYGEWQEMFKDRLEDGRRQAVIANSITD